MLQFESGSVNCSQLKANEKLTEKEISKLMEIAKKPINTNSKEDMKEREDAIFKLASVFFARNEKEKLQEVIPLLKNHILTLSKPRASKLVQNLLELIIQTDMDKGPAIDLCSECIKWAEEAKSTFLAYSLKVRLAELFYELGDYQKCIPLVQTVVTEMKIFDNKRQSVEVLLLESKLYYAVGNLAKSKASLSSARITGTAVYISPRLQADLDMQSASIHAKDKDFYTAYSYFFEAYDLYRSADCPKAAKALKYMLLCKIMLNRPDDVPVLMSHKVAQPFIDESLRAFEKIAMDFKEGSVQQLCEDIDKYKTLLFEDVIIKDHLDDLIENLIEKSILKAIKPYSAIGLDYLAEKLQLNKLSSMILDRIFEGILDQGCEILEIRKNAEEDLLLKKASDLINSLDELVDTMTLKEKAFIPV